MGSSPRFKVYTAQGDYVASCKDGSDAVVLAGFRGPGTTVRDGHTKRRTVYTEGQDGQAGESIDAAVDALLSNLHNLYSEDK